MSYIVLTRARFYQLGHNNYLSQAGLVLTKKREHTVSKARSDYVHIT